MPNICRYCVRFRTGWPGYSLLWLGEIESMKSRFNLNVAARTIVWVYPSKPACCWDVQKATDRQRACLGSLTQTIFVEASLWLSENDSVRDFCVTLVRHNQAPWPRPSFCSFPVVFCIVMIRHLFSLQWSLTGLGSGFMCLSDQSSGCSFVGLLLNVPETCLGISGTNLLRHIYVLPHWDISCRSNFLPRHVTDDSHLANQFHRWPYNARCLAGYNARCLAG